MLTAYCQTQATGSSTPNLWTVDASGKGSQATGITLKIEGADKTMGTDTLKANSENTIEQVVMEIPAAGTYCFGDSVLGKINIYYLEVEF